MMRIGRLPPTHEAGLRRDEFEMGFVPIAPRFTDREHALVDRVPIAAALSVAGIFYSRVNTTCWGWFRGGFFFDEIPHCHYFRAKCIFHEPSIEGRQAIFCAHVSAGPTDGLFRGCEAC